MGGRASEQTQTGSAEMGVEWAGRPADRLEGWRVGASVRSTRLILLSISNCFWLMERGGPAGVGAGGGGEPTGRHAQQASMQQGDGEPKGTSFHDGLLNYMAQSVCSN